MPKCRDCKLYNLDAVRSKSGAVLSNRAAKCKKDVIKMLKSFVKLSGGPLDGQLQKDPSTNQFEVVCREPVTFFKTPIATVKSGIKVAGFYVRSRFDHSQFDWRAATP